ncbi:dr1-associated corepressor homolog [Chenopodium quinoa]|uniref:dr1-associated corepressor homolog n=1 Tax=Chenopodium quinoa TaxID=63459 RepID=UPI000B76FB8F|nr:dr1-associated corepressor homolog [Chenopodium quinoa]
MKSDILGNPSEVTAPKLMKKLIAIIMSEAHFIGGVIAGGGVGGNSLAPRAAFGGFGMGLTNAQDKKGQQGSGQPFGNFIIKDSNQSFPKSLEKKSEGKTSEFNQNFNMSSFDDHPLTPLNNTFDNLPFGNTTSKGLNNQPFNITLGNTFGPPLNKSSDLRFSNLSREFNQLPISIPSLEAANNNSSREHSSFGNYPGMYFNQTSSQFSKKNSTKSSSTRASKESSKKSSSEASKQSLEKSSKSSKGYKSRATSKTSTRSTSRQESKQSSKKSRSKVSRKSSKKSASRKSSSKGSTINSNKSSRKATSSHSTMKSSRSHTSSGKQTFKGSRKLLITSQ